MIVGHLGNPENVSRDERNQGWRWRGLGIRDGEGIWECRAGVKGIEGGGETDGHTGGGGSF